MRRLTFVFAVLAMALTTALVVGPGPVRTSAQGSTPSAGAGFVGAWRLTIAEPGRAPFPALTTFAADGTLIGSDPPVEPASGGQPATISSAGHGVWHPTGPNTAQLTFVELATDLQGQFLGTATISSQLTLGADQNSFRGPFTVTVADPTGKVLFVGTGTVQATRITVQPMASPAAGTPAA